MTIALEAPRGRLTKDQIRRRVEELGEWFHNLDLEGVQAEVYFAWCDNDPTAPVDTIKVMTDALDAAGVVHTVDFFTEAEHGFAPPGGRYNREASELHWERVHSLLTRNL